MKEIIVSDELIKVPVLVSYCCFRIDPKEQFSCNYAVRICGDAGYCLL